MCEELKSSRVQACYALTAELLARDPYALEAMPVHLAAALELGKKNELFLHSHKYANISPGSIVCLPDSLQSAATEQWKTASVHASGNRHA